MSNIKELKQRDKYNINIVEMLDTIVSVKQTKYIDLLLRVLENGATEDYKTTIIKELSTNFNADVEKLKKFTPLQLCVIYPFICNSFEDEKENTDEIKKLNRFFEYNEKGLVKNNDLMTYKTSKQILDEVAVIDEKLEEKRLEKEVIKLLDNEDWLVLKPLTFEASCKYGANTTWCTTTKNEPKYFKQYTKDAILIYSMNKKTGYKVATHYNFKDEELSFWNEADKKVESASTKLPNDIISIIRDECVFNSNKKSNESIFLSKNGKIKNKIEQAIERESIIDNSYFGDMYGVETEEAPDEPSDEPALNEYAIPSNSYITGDIGRGESIYNNIPPNPYEERRISELLRKF